MEEFGNPEDYLKGLDDDELVSQYHQLTIRMKNDKKSADLIKKEMMERINSRGENITTSDYVVSKSSRKGATILDRDKVFEFIKEVGADERLFYKTGQTTFYPKVTRRKL